MPVTLNLDELSRLEPDRSVLAATVLPEPAQLSAPQVFRVELVKARRARDAVVATTRLELQPADAARGVVARFDLARIVDADGLSAIRHGRYFVRATAVGSPAPPLESADLSVRLLTAHRLAADYLHGLTQLGADVLGPKYQPRAISGVEIIEVEPNTQPGFYPLSCNVDASGQRSLKWAGGPTVALDPRFQRFVLPDNRDGYVEVELVDPSALPAASIEESILIARAKVDDLVLGRFVDRATDWLEHTALQLFLEPTVLSTDGEVLPRLETGFERLAPPQRLDHDFIAPPLTFYVQPAGKWTGIRFPYAHVTKVFGLVGQIAGAPVLGLPISWIQLQEKIGFAQIVPFHQQAARSLFNLLAGDIFHGVMEIPSFWRFAIRVGLREVPGDVVEAIAKKAALDALTVIGQAFKPGVSSESFSKEMSVATSYVRNAQANLLSASRAEYKADLDALIPRLKNRYLGLSNVAIV